MSWPAFDNPVFVEAVADMREKQKAYFKCRTKETNLPFNSQQKASFKISTKEALIASKQAEKIVDDLLRELMK